MSFISSEFFVFFIVFGILYWLLFNKQLIVQNLFLLLGSYLFYAWADLRLLLLLISISILNYFLGIYISKNSTDNRLKRRLLLLGIIQGIGALLFYKYLGIFVSLGNNLLVVFHFGFKLKTLNWVAPLGISFFTFKSISYLLDIYKGKIEACNNWIAFFIYLSFFPTVIAGPIDRSCTFIPQLLKPRHFVYEDAAEGTRQILWGLFKKMVIADNCIDITSSIYYNYNCLPGSSLLIGAILYSFQLYADFSGYSDIAIGISRLLGFKVTKNFDYPFFAENIAMFWRKWHISLTSWFTEYVFIPLNISFRSYGKIGLILAVELNFALIGIWHGANFTYLLFGVLHGLYFIPLILMGNLNRSKKIVKEGIFTHLKKTINILSTFFLVTFTLIVFQAPSVNEALLYYKKIFSYSLFIQPIIAFKQVLLICSFIAIMLVLEWFGRKKDFGISQMHVKWPTFLRWSVYILLFFLILVFSSNTHQFVYASF